MEFGKNTWLMLYKTFLFYVVVTVALANKPKQGGTSEDVMMEVSTGQEQDGMLVIIVEVRVQVKMFCHEIGLKPIYPFHL